MFRVEVIITENINANTRREIAAQLTNKEELARIKTEQLIRDDYLIDAMAIMELYMTLLLARLGLLEASKECDPSLKEAVCSILWAIPRLDAHVPELKEIRKGLQAHFGEKFVRDAMTNLDNAVSQKMIVKLSIVQVNPAKVEDYLQVIAEKYSVPYTPKESMALDELTGGPLFSSKVPPHLAPAAEPYVGAPYSAPAVANPLYSTPGAPAYPPGAPPAFAPGPYAPAPYAPPGPLGAFDPLSKPPLSSPPPAVYSPSAPPAAYTPSAAAYTPTPPPAAYPPSVFAPYQPPAAPVPGDAPDGDDGLLDLPDPPSSRPGRRPPGQPPSFPPSYPGPGAPPTSPPGSSTAPDSSSAPGDDGLDLPSLPSVPGGAAPGPGGAGPPPSIPDFDDLARRFDALRNQQS